MMTEGNGRADFAKLAADFRAAVKPEALDALAAGLGVSVESLRRLGIGWSADHGAWSFPMSNPAGEVVGIRLRLPSGRKLAVKGGREGLFIPAGLACPGPLLIAEGPTDTAALLDLGFSAVGRPSCRGGVKLLIELTRQRPAGTVVIVADSDTPGQRGADHLAAMLTAYRPGASVRVVTPAAPHKDARAWKQAGATAPDVLRAIEAAPVRRLTITTTIPKRKAGRWN